MNRRPGQPPRAQLPPLTPGERLFLAFCAALGLAIAGVYVWAIASGAAPWWLVLIG